MHTNRARLLIVAAGLAVLAFFLFVPPIAQDETYHSFADRRLGHSELLERGFECAVRRCRNFWFVETSCQLGFALPMGNANGAAICTLQEAPCLR